MTLEIEPNVYIIESLEPDEETTHREGEIISRTLRLSEKKSKYVYVRTKREFEHFAAEFGNSQHRYLHLSCHGSKSGKFWTTLDPIPSADMIHILTPHLKGRRLFISSCLACNRPFAEGLLNASGCISVVGPFGTINFDDAAVFWASFYHLMFKRDRERMKRAVIRDTVTKCATLVGERFHFFRKEHGEFRSSILGPKREMQSKPP